MYYRSPKFSPCVKGLIIANAVVFVLQMLPVVGDIVFQIGAMVPTLAFFDFQFWRFASYMFLHSPDMLFHIIINMLLLWWFGTELEDIWGGKKFLIFYFVCGIGAGLFSSLYLFINPRIAVIGASGAVLGVLTAYAFYYPARQILLFFIIPIKVKTLVIGYAIISALFSLRGDGTAHLTHLGGIAVAFGYLKLVPMIRLTIGKWQYALECKKRDAMQARAVNRKKYYENEIDPILDKIAKSGMASLTPGEMKKLKKASEDGRDLFRKK